ncbi:DEAD/DEAH box helicase [Spirochaetia bacterium]|nr:DEAD/DEAH box helicase [Spirochaetia bacterium]
MTDSTIFSERIESQDRAIKVLKKLGYTYVSRSEADTKRGSRNRVLFEDDLRNFLGRQKFSFGKEKFNFSPGSIGKAIRDLDIPITQGLSQCNKQIYDLLYGGKSLEETLPDGSLQSFDIRYIDFEKPENNIFQVTEEFEVERTNGKYARPDIVALVNGIPLVVIECKKSSVDVWAGVKQHIRNWGNDYIPQLFKFSQILITTNLQKLMYGTCGTPEQHFVSWHEEDKEWLNALCRKCSPDTQITEQDRALISLLEPQRLLEMIRHFIIYDNNIKKIARYKQYFAVKKSLRRIRQEDNQGTRNGVIWHTQGSGKTLTMIMLTKLIINDTAHFKNPRFIMVTDRINLDKQIRDNFLHTTMSPHRAGTGKGLIELLQDEENTVITALVNKFEAAIKQDYRNTADNLFLFIDEGHRSHYGKLNIYMSETLPNAVKIAFTGTPLMNEVQDTGNNGLVASKNTYYKFGPLIDKYSLEDAIQDKVTVPILYEGRIIPQKVTSSKINDHLKYITVGLSQDEAEDLQRKWSRFLALAQTKERLAMIAYDVYEHFIRYVKPKKFKAILTCSSREACIDVYKFLKKLGGINPAVIITPNNQYEGDDDTKTTESLKKIAQFFAEEIEPMYKNNYDLYEDTKTSNFVDPEGEIDILIVKDKLLTGFNAPAAAVLYVDKSMRDHTLLQAIARVNRVYENKEFGLVVDYFGVFKKLNSALDLYSDTDSNMNLFNPEDIKSSILSLEDEKRDLEEKYQAVWVLFEGINKKSGSEAWQKWLYDSSKRKTFYAALASFGKRLDFLFTSYELFQLVGKKKAEQYKKDYIFFKKLKDSVSLRYNDRVQFSDYEDGIKQLLDTYVNASDSKTLIEPLDIQNKQKMQEQLSLLGSKEAKGDAIKSRQVEVLESKRYDDPLLYLTFMEKINKTLEDYAHDRDAEAYYFAMETMAEDYREERSFMKYPEIIMDDSDAKAFYGSILSGIKEKRGDVLPEDSRNPPDSLARLALAAKAIIKEYAKRDWRDNFIVHRNIKAKLDDLIFNYIEQNELFWDLTIIDLIIEKIMLTALKRF